MPRRMPLADGLVRRPGVDVSVGSRRCRCSHAPPLFLIWGNQQITNNKKFVGRRPTRQIRNRRTTSEAMSSNYWPYIRGWEHMTGLEYLYHAAGIFSLSKGVAPWTDRQSNSDLSESGRQNSRTLLLPGCKKRLPNWNSLASVPFGLAKPQGGKR